MKHFIFTEQELIDGFAIKKIELDKYSLGREGFEYYSNETVELPEFISLEGLERIKKKSL